MPSPYETFSRQVSESWCMTTATATSGALSVTSDMPYFTLFLLLLLNVIRTISCCIPTRQKIRLDGNLIVNPFPSLPTLPKQQDRVMRLLDLIEYTLVTNNCPVTSSLTSPQYPASLRSVPPLATTNWGELQPQVDALISSAQACQLNVSLLQDIVRISMNSLRARCKNNAIRYNEQWTKDDYYNAPNGGMQESSWSYNNNSNKFNNYDDSYWTNNRSRFGYDAEGRIGLYGPLFPIPILPNNNYNGNINYPYNYYYHSGYGLPFPSGIGSGDAVYNALYRNRLIPNKCKNAPVLPPPPPPYT